MSLADVDLIPQVQTIAWLAPPRRPRKQSSHGKFNIALIVSRYLSNCSIFLIFGKKKKKKKFHFQEFLKIFHFEINFKLLVHSKEEKSLTVDHNRFIKLIAFRKRKFFVLRSKRESTGVRIDFLDRFSSR